MTNPDLQTYRREAPVFENPSESFTSMIVRFVEFIGSVA